jgi:hypothetical protein
MMAPNRPTIRTDVDLPVARLGPRRWIGGVLLIVGLAVAAPAPAQEEVDSVRATLADGRTIAGTLRSITGSEVTVSGPAALSIATSELVRLDFNHSRTTAGRAALIQLVNGDRIVAGLSSLSDEALVVLWKSYPDWPPVRVPAEAVAGILMAVPEGAVERARAFRQVFGRREKSDVVMLVNGDRVAGDLTAFDQATLKLSQAGKPLQIEMGRVRGIAFNSDLTSLPASQKKHVRVTLTDGSQLTASEATREPGGALRIATAFGAQLEVPLSAVSSIRFLDGRAADLSDLEPQEARLDGFFGSKDRSPFAKDRNLAGGPLVVHGTEYAKGLGTRSQSAITFDLAGRFTQFRSLAAIDDLAQGKGSVRFVVEVDGNRVFASNLVTGASEPVLVGPIAVSGRRRLTLIVEYGELADVDDWADWCDPILIR